MFVVQNESPKRTKVPKKTIDKKFKSDFSVLYETKRGSDVILVAGNQEFNAHKAILMARSDVFAAMFDNQMRESIENKVEIRDIEPEVLEVMILYLYTGDVKDMVKIGAPLMSAANKYGLDELKTICSRHLITNICTDTAIETLILSKLMNDSNLKRSALEFIRDNSRDVIATKDWINLKKSNSELLDEILLFSTNNHSIEAKISWNLRDLSNFKTSQMSEISEVHGIPWRINAIPVKKYRTIEGQQSVTTYLGVYLQCDLSEPSSDFSCNVQGTLKLIPVKGGTPCKQYKINKKCDQGRMYLGFSKFESLDKLLDPNTGYIKDDTIILEANIIVDPPKGVTNCGPMIADSSDSSGSPLSFAFSDNGDSSPASDVSSDDD